MASYTHHRLDVYPVDLYLASNRRAYGHLRRKHKQLVPADSAGLTQIIEDEGVVVIYVDKSLDTVTLLEVVAHEAAHAALFIFELIGQEPVPAHEPFAYLTGWLTKWAWTNLHLEA